MMSEFTIKDSGQRQDFASGMVRDVADDKTDHELIFNGPMADRWAEHLTKGAKKYPDVELGVPNWTLASGKAEMIRFRKSAARHFRDWLRGKEDEDHAAATFFNINGHEYVKGKMARVEPECTCWYPLIEHVSKDESRVLPCQVHPTHHEVHLPRPMLDLKQYETNIAIDKAIRDINPPITMDEEFVKRYADSIQQMLTYGTGFLVIEGDQEDEAEFWGTVESLLHGYVAAEEALLQPDQDQGPGRSRSPRRAARRGPSK